MHIILVIHQSTKNLFTIETVFSSPVNGLESFNGVGFLNLSQELGRAWRVWEEEENDNRENNSWCTLCFREYGN